MKTRFNYKGFACRSIYSRSMCQNNKVIVVTLLVQSILSPIFVLSLHIIMDVYMTIALVCQKIKVVVNLVLIILARGE